jgi:8-oxo-dGTP pyrophosphatase MutT (NUDIX family)
LIDREGVGPVDVEVRTTARVILLDQHDRVLLLSARDPSDRRVVWFVPGGGVEEGESLLETALRELQEEVPQAGTVDLHGPVWRRHHVFSWNAHPVDQTEFFFVARLTKPLEAADVNVGGAEQEFFEGARWATMQDLADWPAEDLMAPVRLRELLEPILAGDYPAEPIETGP